VPGEQGNVFTPMARRSISQLLINLNKDIDAMRGIYPRPLSRDAGSSGRS
jgi:hypothetical protein